ncbi:MAG TPA: toxin-antitoxin system HicB family antitoxin [Gaiellaceae bacterium]|nr:toxin-antitoxin system HicB family antitoxin [Gaiellaceae bacterium]
MRQLITRIDDDLHARVKERARVEGKSVNTYVTELLEDAARPLTPKEQLRERLRAAGMLVELEIEGPVPDRDEVIESLRGASDVVLDALEAGRAPR